MRKHSFRLSASEDSTVPMAGDKKTNDASGAAGGLFSAENLKLAFLVTGTLATFTIFGYAQEALTRGTYDGERFSFPLFLIVLQATSNLICSAAILFLSKEKQWSAGAPIKDWGIVSSAYLGAHFCGLQALAYIPFPMQVVCKSCKAVPVMIGEKILDGKKHSREKEIQVMLMVLGVVMFTLTSGSKKGGGSDWDLTPTLALGLALVLGALVCDGIYGPYQNTITKNYKANSYHLMFNMNLYELMLVVPLCFFNDELLGGLNFVIKHPEIIPKMLYFGSMMAAGSLFLFNLQSSFGALTVTLTTTLRKLISVVFSVFWFGHHLGAAQWAAACIVFLAHPLSEQIVKLLGNKKQGHAL